MDRTELTALVARAQQGDREAFAQVYQATFEHVYYTAFKILHSEQQAQDIAQETYITVMQKLPTLQDPGAFLGWLRQIAANKCGNYIQKKKEVLYAPQDGDEDGGLPDVEADRDEQPDEVLEKDSTRQIILSIIDSLPVEQRAAVVMFYFQQMPVKAIAQATGEAEGTIKSRLNYARRQIKQGVEKEEARSGIRLHSLPALFLLRLFLQDAASHSAPAGVRQAVLDAALLPPDAGAAAAQALPKGGAAKGQPDLHGGPKPPRPTGKAAANAVRDAGGRAAAKGLSAAVKAGLAAAGVAVAGGVAAIIIAVSQGGAAPDTSMAPSAPVSSLPAPPAASSSLSLPVSSEEEPPPEPEGLPGVPVFGGNDSAFVFKYLLADNYPLFPADMDTYLGSEAEEGRHGANEHTGVYGEDYHYGGMDFAYFELNGSPQRLGFYWPDTAAANSGAPPDVISIRLANYPENPYNLFGFYTGMTVAEMQAQIDYFMQLEGCEADLIEFSTGLEGLRRTPQYHLDLVFPEAGIQVRIHLVAFPETDSVQAPDAAGKLITTDGSFYGGWGW